MKVKVKRLVETAVIPTYAKVGDAGMDLVATSKSYDDNGNVIYGTGLAFEIPEGYVGLLFPRSSIAKQDLLLTNSVGVIDSGYRGEVMMKFKPSFDFTDFDKTDENSVFVNEREEKLGISMIAEFYCVGDKIGQIIVMPYPKVEFNEVSELSETERGEGGYGSTGV